MIGLLTLTLLGVAIGSYLLFESVTGTVRSRPAHNPSNEAEFIKDIQR